jgi:hypothetical protein
LTSFPFAQTSGIIGDFFWQVEKNIESIALRGGACLRTTFAIFKIVKPEPEANLCLTNSSKRFKPVTSVTRMCLFWALGQKLCITAYSNMNWFFVNALIFLCKNLGNEFFYKIGHIIGRLWITWVAVSNHFWSHCQQKKHLVGVQSCGVCGVLGSHLE